MITAKAAARPIHIKVQPSASRKRMTRCRRWKTPRSSTNMSATNALNSTQKSVLSPNCSRPCSLVYHHGAIRDEAAEEIKAQQTVACDVLEGRGSNASAHHQGNTCSPRVQPGSSYHRSSGPEPTHRLCAGEHGLRQC